jgi:uncharacterized membrane protein
MGSLYEVSVAVHVAAAVVGFGATFTYPVIQVAAERGDRRALPFAMAAILAVSRFVAVPATTLVGATGLYQLVDGPYGLDDAWLAIGIVLYAAVMSTGVLYLAPAYRRAERAAVRMVEAAPAGTSVELSPEYRAAVRGPARVGPAVAASVLAILVLMEVKPG